MILEKWAQIEIQELPRLRSFSGRARHAGAFRVKGALG